MKIIWHSAPPWNQTGYGVQTYEWVKRLKRAGHEVVVAANCQLNGAPKIQWNGLDVYPIGFHEWGADAVQAWNTRWDADMVITLMDTWVLPENLGEALENWYPMSPIDTEPISPPVLARMKYAKLPLAMSRHAQSEFTKNGLDSVLLLHGVDCKVYRPGLTKALKSKGFLVGMVASNMSHDRKAYWQNLKAFSIFKKNHPEAEIYCHTFVTAKDSGFDLLKMADHLGIEINFPDAWQMKEGIPPERMAQIYNSFDVLLMASKSEGFGVPLIEAQACGVPVITTKHSSMTENCGVGWLVNCDEQWMQLDAKWGVPKVDEIVEALELAYQNKDNQELKDQARAFASYFDFDYLFEKQWIPFLEKASKMHKHRWARTGLVNVDGSQSVPCITCTDELRIVNGRKTIVKNGFKDDINGLKLDIEDDPTGAVKRIVYREIEEDYNLDNLKVKKGDVLVDVGAHVGIVSIYLAKRYPQATIIAVEPNPNNATRLERNIEANHVDNITVYRNAIAEEEKDVELGGDGSTNSGGHSMFSKGNDTFLVHAITLEQLLKPYRKVKLLKLDCEGGEFSVTDPDVLKKVESMRGEFHKSYGDTKKLMELVKKYVKDVQVKEV